MSHNKFLGNSGEDTLFLHGFYFLWVLDATEATYLNSGDWKIDLNPWINTAAVEPPEMHFTHGVRCFSNVLITFGDEK